MGRIRGDIDVVGIANILQMLAISKVQGILTVWGETRKKVVEFGLGGIRLVGGGRPAKPLGEILLRTGRITADQLDELLAEQQRTGTPLGELVATREIVSKELVDGALREQVADEIYEIFTWSKATFEFATMDDPNAPAPEEGPLSSIVLGADVVTLMVEAARRIDEFARIRSLIPDERLLVQRMELAAAVDESGMDRHAVADILPLVDGERSVAQIIEESLYPKFTVLRTICSLAEAGVVRIRARRDRETALTLFNLPALAAEEKPAADGRTILILTDAPGLRTTLALRVRRSGFDAIECRNDADAAETLSRGRVDVIVVDVAIETEEGLRRCNRLRQTTAAPFILLTANTSRQAARNAIDCGARYVLLKPVNEARLMERVSEILEGRRKGTGGWKLPPPAPTPTP